MMVEGGDFPGLAVLSDEVFGEVETEKGLEHTEKKTLWKGRSDKKRALQYDLHGFNWIRGFIGKVVDMKHLIRVPPGWD